MAAQSSIAALRRGGLSPHEFAPSWFSAAISPRGNGSDGAHDKAEFVNVVKTEPSKTIVTEGTSGALRRTLVRDFPEVEQATRTIFMEIRVEFEKKSFSQRIAAVDPAFLEIFDFQFVTGRVAQAFQNPESVIITDEMARDFAFPD